MFLLSFSKKKREICNKAGLEKDTLIYNLTTAFGIENWLWLVISLIPCIPTVSDILHKWMQFHITNFYHALVRWSFWSHAQKLGVFLDSPYLPSENKKSQGASHWILCLAGKPTSLLSSAGAGHSTSCHILLFKPVLHPTLMQWLDQEKCCW